MAQKVRIKDKELDALVDAFESSYMFQHPLPKAVVIAKAKSPSIILGRLFAEIGRSNYVSWSSS